MLKSDCLAVLFPLWVCCRIVGHLCGLDCWTQRHAELIVIVDTHTQTHTSAERIPTTIRRTDASSSKHKRLWRLGFLSQHISLFFFFFFHPHTMCNCAFCSWQLEIGKPLIDTNHCFMPLCISVICKTYLQCWKNSVNPKFKKPVYISLSSHCSDGNCFSGWCL